MRPEPSSPTRPAPHLRHSARAQNSRPGRSVCEPPTALRDAEIACRDVGRHQHSRPIDRERPSRRWIPRGQPALGRPRCTGAAISKRAMHSPAVLQEPSGNAEAHCQSLCRQTTGRPSTRTEPGTTCTERLRPYQRTSAWAVQKSTLGPRRRSIKAFATTEAVFDCESDLPMVSCRSTLSWACRNSASRR